MSQASVDLLLRGYRAFVAGDLDAIEQMLDPEVEWLGVGDVAGIADRGDVLDVLRERLERTREEELDTALEELVAIAEDRWRRS